MGKSLTHRMLDAITCFYLSSPDFNGMDVLQALPASLGLEYADIIDALSQLMAEEKVGVVYSDTDVNPHILRVGYDPKEVQIAKLATVDAHACVYPLPKHLERVVDPSQYQDRPYLLCLALGEPQLAYRAFDLSVLEVYRNDPRYRYVCDDISGHICATGEYAEDMPESDRVMLQSFGFCYDDELNRAVAVFLYRLSRLTAEHQQIWRARELQGDYALHPDFWQRAIAGRFGEGVSVFSAFLEELRLINRMAEAMGRPRLFRKDYRDDSRPVGFSFLVRPTLKELNDFVLLLDKMISDNINKDFFLHEVALEREQIRADGRVVVERKGTLAILEDWIRDRFHTDDWEPIDSMFSFFGRVRRMRQRPAHALDDNVFDQSYFRQQRDLIVGAYESLQTLRLLLANHPAAGQVPVPRRLSKGTIWKY